MVSDADTHALRAFDFDQLWDQLEELRHLHCRTAFHSFAEPMDSSDMKPGHWIEIAELIQVHYARYDGFVVLHGSDTMAYSASALSLMLENLGKPVIFTGSQLPLGALRTDARENLITSIQLAALRQGAAPLIQEVGLYFGYKLLRANRSTKVNAVHFEAFASPNFPPLAESGVQLSVDKSLLLRKPGVLAVNKVLNTRTALVKFSPGIDPSFLRALLDESAIEGVLLETYGSGNASTEKWFLKWLETALDKGLKIANVTQCIGGSVALGRYETSRFMKTLGIASGYDITTESALAKMMLLLPCDCTNDEFKAEFEKPWAGELSPSSKS